MLGPKRVSVRTNDFMEQLFPQRRRIRVFLAMRLQDTRIDLPTPKKHKQLANRALAISPKETVRFRP